MRVLLWILNGVVAAGIISVGTMIYFAIDFYKFCKKEKEEEE